jgi:DNA-binding response OmpR family regulator
MPQIDGIELLRFAKSRNALTQVLFLTGHSTQDTLLGALEFGATDYLLKPIDREQLVARLQEAQSRKRRWQQALGEVWKKRRKQVAAN